MKKILFLTNNWFGDHGGRRIVSSKIVNYLSNNGYDITVVNFESGSSRKNYDFQNRIHTQTYFIKENSKLAPYLVDISKTGKFDLIICSGGPHFDIMTVLTIKMRRLFMGDMVVLFAHVHPLRSIKVFSFSVKDSIFNLGYYLLSHVSYGFFSKIVVPSVGLKEFFNKKLFVGQKNIIVINNPILKQNDVVISTKKRSLKRINKEKILITVTRLNTFQKDFKTLFLALKEINKKINCRLIILGEGEDKRKIIELSKKLGVTNKIKLVGFMNNPIRYINQADIFVFSSFYEGFGNALIEAMAGGIPIVASNCDFGPKEILENGKNGILFPVGDYRSMTKSILTLLQDNKLISKFIKNSRSKIEDYYETKSFQKWGKLIDKLS